MHEIGRMRPLRKASRRCAVRVQALAALFSLALISACTDPAELRNFSPIEFPFNLPPIHTPPPILGIPLHAEEDIFTEIPGMTGHHGATIAALPGGRLLAAWYSYSGPTELEGPKIYAASRGLFDSTWSTPAPLVSRFDATANPVLFHESGELWLFFAVIPIGWSTAHIEYQRSSDLGATWSSARTIEGPLGANVRFPPIRLRDNRLLLPAYDDLFKRSLFFVSADGEDWALQPIVTSAENARPIQPSVVELDSGRLLAVMRNTESEWLWVMASDDDAKTWSRPDNSGFPNPDSAAALYKLANRHLILVYNDNPIARHPLTIALSTDNGETWPYKRVLADGEEEYHYPSITQTFDGMIHVVYTNARKTIRHASFNEAWIVH